MWPTCNHRAKMLTLVVHKEREHCVMGFKQKHVYMYTHSYHEHFGQSTSHINIHA